MGNKAFRGHYDLYALLRWYFSDTSRFQEEFDLALDAPGEQCNDQKIFVIGLNKTGTTSVKQALIDHQISVGVQGQASDIFVYEKPAFFVKELLNYCQSAVAFQDIPFSVPGVYRLLNRVYPDAKFILTVRNNASEWFRSLSKFSANVYAKGKDLKQHHLILNDRYPLGYAYIRHQKIFGRSRFFDQPYYEEFYHKHLEDVRSFFKDKPDDFLELNISDATAYRDFCNFLGLKPLYDVFPWENKTK